MAQRFSSLPLCRQRIAATSSSAATAVATPTTGGIFDRPAVLAFGALIALGFQHLDLADRGAIVNAIRANFTATSIARITRVTMRLFLAPWEPTAIAGLPRKHNSRYTDRLAFDLITLLLNFDLLRLQLAGMVALWATVLFCMMSTTRFDGRCGCDCE